MAFHIQLLYPNDPFSPKSPDEMFEEEYRAAQAARLPVALYSHEDLLAGQGAMKSELSPGVHAVLRGWMLTVEMYGALEQQLGRKSVPMLTSPSQYERCHCLPGWYSQLRDVTPDTVFAAEGDDFEQIVTGKNWSGFFVKDHVKSLTTGRGSVCESSRDIAEVVRSIRQYRGTVEGGVVIRELERFQNETEERFFVFQGVPFARIGPVPSLITRIASLIDSPFFSIDTVLRADGQLRVVELGDGQVSDRKSWSAGAMIGVLLKGGA